MRRIVEKIPVNSIRFRIIAGVFSVLSLLVLLMVFNNIYAIRVIRSQVYSSNKKTLYMYLKHVDSGFSDVETYLAGLRYDNPDLSVIEYPLREVDRYTAVHRKQQNLTLTLPGYSTIDGLFIYSTPASIYIDAVQTRIPAAERKRLKQDFIDLLDSDNNGLIAQKAGQWFSLRSSEEHYLCRILKFGDTYTGAWVNVDTLTAEIEQSGFNGADRVFFCRSDGTPLDAFLYQEGINISMTDSLQHFTLLGDRNRYLMIAQPSVQGEYYLVAMIRDNNILEGLAAFQPMILAVAVGVLTAIGMLAIALHRLMVQPLGKLTEAIRSLKSGNLDAKITEKNPCREFIEVNQAFSEMTFQIKHLKIDVYEEKLLRQKVQLQYLQQQVAPHFFINCLSTIYSLAGTGKIGLVQQMSLALSNHLRYTLSKNATVTLEKELIHVTNYLELCRLRFPDSIACELSLPEDIKTARIPPLLLQTFVENTVKYEVDAGELTTIYIVGNKLTEERQAKIHLTIWDTGEGFSAEILEKLCRNDWEPTEDGKMIGLYNVVQRLRLIYRGDVCIRFGNREGAGAQIDIIIPFEEKGDMI